MRRLCLLALLVAACGKGQPKEQTWTIRSVPPLDGPAGAVEVSATVPADWTPEVDNMGAPDFKTAERTSFGIATIVAVACSESDEKKCVDKVVSMQFGDDLKDAKIEDVGGHRWIQRKNENNEMIHGRLFWPVMQKQTVVMCVALMVEPATLPTVRKFCETMKVKG